MSVFEMLQTRGKLYFNEPLASYTSWRVGGYADCLFRPADMADLQSFLQQIPDDTSVTWLGLGSNTLVRDNGIRGVVILTLAGLNDISLIDDTRVRVEAGVTCAKVAKFCARNSLQDVSFLAGVPGTMGGALAMNAGAFGGETWPHVESVETIDAEGKIRSRLANTFDVAYRSVKGLGDEKFVAGILNLKNGDCESAMKKIRECLQKRNDSQPTGVFSGGSVFKNPEGDYSGRLIEASGLKGLRVGGASVSEKHANFILNDKTATANDIEQLILQVATEVKTRFGVALETEVKVMGES